MKIDYQRRQSSIVQIGNTPLGGTNPIRIQSMANVSTMDTDACVQQAICMIQAGSEYIRFTAQGEREAHNLGVIRNKLHENGYQTPLIADIHFNPKAAEVAAVNVDKVRINPGNYVDKVKSFEQRDYSADEHNLEIQKIRNRFIPFLELCRDAGTAIRIGVNHGSLSDRIMSHYGDTPEGMVASCMEFLRICQEQRFNNVVISMKASNVVVMVQSVRLLVETMEREDMYYPLHLGVTEAGDDEDGRIKSAVGIGALLIDGIGDTIRVSLSEPPEAELPVARKLVNYILFRENHESVDPTLSTKSYSLFDLKRTVQPVLKIGGTNFPIVISDHSYLNNASDSSCQADFIYVGNNNSQNNGTIPLLIDADYWNEELNTFPYFRLNQWTTINNCKSSLLFLELFYADLNQELLHQICNKNNLVLVFNSIHPNYVGEARAFILRLKEAGCKAPVILRRQYNETDHENFQIKAAVDFGPLFIDGIGNGLFLSNEQIASHICEGYAFSILQAARARISKTEYISCPGCGRTLYNLQSTIAQIKKATNHLKGLKIGIMGCIVNGPGEMADADYGYVGAAAGCISLYKGKVCVMKNIPEEKAVEQLILLIQENGDWVDPA